MISLVDTKKYETDRSNHMLYTFDEIGEIYRTIFPFLGKHARFHQIQVQAVYYMHKRFEWDYSSSFKELYGKALQTLKEKGIVEDKRALLKFDVPLDNLYASSFYTSDDPEVWRRIQKQKEDEAKIRRVEKRLDGK